MKKIVILGTGGNCIDVLDALREINVSRRKKIYDCVGFLDDDESKWNRSVRGIRVLGPLEIGKDLKDCSFVFGIGSVSNFWQRHEILVRSGIAEERFESIVHPTASVSKMSMLGRGVIVLQNATIASDVTVERFVYILPNTILSHNDYIGEFTCLAGGVSLSGDVRVGRNCYIGANSSVREGVTIENSCLVGMGSVVLDNVPENTVVVGNPAKFLRHTRVDSIQR
jgi:sugar O-acyltransferase (sialic acid O-acetyltransferase NeuD family)